MRFVSPVEVTPANLDSTNVSNDYPDWAAGTYNAGDRVVNDLQAWEALQTTTVEPSEDAPTDWLRLGFSNRYRMFRDGRDSQSSAVGGIDVTVTPGALFTTVAALGLQGSEAVLTVTDPTEGVVFTETISLVDIGVTDWFQFFFSSYGVDTEAVFDGIPPYPAAEYRLQINTETPGDTALCGRVVAGEERTLGISNYGTIVRANDYSTKERDGFGNLTLVPRRVVRLATYDVTVESAEIDYVVNQLNALASIVTLYIGETNYGSTIVLGIWNDYRQEIGSPSVSKLIVDVEGF